MGLRVNHNTASLLIRHNLDTVQDTLDRTFNRLSSGERLTRTGDDAAGMAISQTMRNDIRGFQQNVKNVNDGVSVTSTIEAGLASINDLLNRMRTLAVQAGNAATTDSDRHLIDLEVQNLLAEVRRVAGETEFNERKLLDGTYTGARIHTGVASGQYLTLTVPDMDATVLGAVAEATGVNYASTNAVAGGGDLVINGYNVPASTDDKFSTHDKAASALAKADAINKVSGQTGVEAEAEPAVYLASGASIGAVALDGGANSLIINGVNLGNVVVQAGDATGNLVARINQLTDQTGVEATLAPGGELQLTAEDGRNIHVETTGGVAVPLGLSTGPADVDVTQTGKITLTSRQTINLGGDLALIGFDPATQVSTAVDLTTALANISIGTFDDAQKAIETIDQALGAVVDTRANIGAIQNRLENLANQLSENVENLAEADSRIRDTDFALETARLTQQQIIQEASLAVLAQANAMPANVLDILMR